MIPHIASGSPDLRLGKPQRAASGPGYGVGVGWTTGFFWMVMVTVTEETVLVMLAGRVSRTLRLMLEEALVTSIGVSVRLSSVASRSAGPVTGTKSGFRSIATIR